ncbi:hypothetical protein NFB47_13725, partial [Yersinia ruckeri]|nr:hypothetical protein [Yersinia ruckeri]
SFTATNGATVTTVIGTTGADGIATATLTNTAAGHSVVTATVNGSSQTVSTTVVAVPAFTGVSVNGTTFATNNGFPSTGFTGAEFSLTVTGAASDYTWSSSASSWAPVDSSGKVSFTSQGNASPVTITATPTGGGTPLTYIFTVGSWFINNGSTVMNWANASTWCTNQSLSQPTRGELTMGGDTRAVGSLWSEWGVMGNYSGSGFDSGYHWTSEADGIGYYYGVSLYNGDVGSNYDSGDLYVVCRQGL